MSDGIFRVVVVVPARDEEEQIADCVQALGRACAELRGEVQASVVVVANRCSDRTVERALLAGAQVLVSDASNVGAARHEGALWAIETSPTDLPSGGLWIAFTDADSLVAPTWLRSQVEAAARGADAFLGTIMLGLDGRRAHPRWAAEYLRAAALGDHHGHVHGANMGVRASTYQATGGFDPVAVHEDRRFVATLAASGARLAWVETEPVRTSARHDARAPAGVAFDLQQSG